MFGFFFTFPFIQILIDEIESFIRNGEAWQLEAIKIYVNRHFPLHLVYVFLSFLVAIAFMLMPLATNKLIIFDAWYPESIVNSSYRQLHYLIYVHHSLAALQSPIGICHIDVVMATILYYAAGKISILRRDFDVANGAVTLKLFIQKHQHIIK